MLEKILMIFFVSGIEQRILNEGTIYENYFLHGDEDTWRRGVFHYGIVVYSHRDYAGAAFGRNRFYITSRGHERKAEQPFMDRDTVFASAYMHETGHTLGFYLIPGHNRNSCPLEKN